MQHPLKLEVSSFSAINSKMLILSISHHHAPGHPAELIMYLENKSEMEMSQAAAQGHQAVAGNFGELRLLQGISESRDTQKLQQSAGQCVIHTEGFVPVRQEDG